MTFQDAFFIAIIILLVFIICNDMRTRELIHLCANRFTPESDTGVPMTFSRIGTTPDIKKENMSGNYEEIAKKALNDQMEYFQVCKDPDEIKKVAECVCDGQDTFDYAENAYGAPGMDYKTWVTSQSVGEDTIRNHQQYTADREAVEAAGNAYFTGRTMSPDSHDSYDPIPWIGLRRPQYVEQCNPTQVPDTDINLYKGNRQFCFKT